MGEQTFWNGEPAPARQCVVRVGSAPHWWSEALEGQERPAVEVTYGGTTLYLEDADGKGWHLVTNARRTCGRYGYRVFPQNSEVVG